LPLADRVSETLYEQERIPACAKRLGLRQSPGAFLTKVPSGSSALQKK
jgi:hypothetical protein